MIRQSSSKHASTLRASLLLALGLSPAVACGGSALTQGESGDAGAGSGGRSGAGAPGLGGHAGHIIGHGGASGGGGEHTTVRPLPYCDDPVTERVSGLVSCSSGYKHRPEARTCTVPTELGVAGSAGEAGAGGEGGASQCQTDADCRHLYLGYCRHGVSDGSNEGAPIPYCESGCQQDSDCGPSGFICLCDGSATGGKCTSASCSVDADCGPTGFCASTNTTCGDPYYSCTSPRDECQGSGDCIGRGCFGDGDHRTCGSVNVCGRPFLIDETARVAELEPRRDWLDTTISPVLRGLSPIERAQLAARWSRLGQMEHASIAAFARFSLQLLALGAPASLVEACNQALIDETAHARLCFAFASAYAGTKLGPSKLDMSHCFEETTLFGVTKLVIAEGCIGETSAALEALEDADRAADPVVRSALLRIASDEQRHAELAYRFVSWALEQCDAQQTQELAREAEERLSPFERTARVRARATRQPRRRHTNSRMSLASLRAAVLCRAVLCCASRHSLLTSFSGHITKEP